MSATALRVACALLIALTGCATEPHSTRGVDTVVLANVPGGVAASSTRHGPFHEERGLAFGFSHDAVGAVIAATHTAARLSPTAGVDVAAATLDEQCWGDIAAARARLAAAPPVSDRPPRGEQMPDALYFRVIGGDATGEHVVVSVLADTVQARARHGFTRVDATLRWSGTDWMLRVPTQVAALHPHTEGYTLLGTRP